MRINKNLLHILTGCLLLLISSNQLISQTVETGKFNYVSPRPGSEYINPASTIALRHGDAFDLSGLQDFVIRVFGSESGLVEGKTVMSDDGRTIIFYPDHPFELGEQVEVLSTGKLLTQSNITMIPVEFTFTITKEIVKLPEGFVEEQEFLSHQSLFPHHLSKYTPQNKLESTNNLPEDFPELTVEVLNETFDNGYYFVSPFGYWGWFPENTPYTIIYDDLGVPVFYQRQGQHCYDFKKNENGLLSYLYNDYPSPFVNIMNSSYEVIDTYLMPEGYVTDFHEFFMLENGHAFIMAYDPQVVDMSQVVPGGVEDAVVVGWIFHELDASKNVVFEWRSWDHYDILDAQGYVNLEASTIDLLHGNAIEVTPDGAALLLSPRNLNEITKVDRNTGEIIWRLNGNNNMFEFIDDTLTFSWQHDCRILENGNLSIFDNGTYHPEPKFSSMIEYEIDEEDFTATLVRRLRSDPDVYGIIMGSSREAQNGNIVNGWGSGVPGVTEFNADGEVAATYYFAGVNYRAHRAHWTSTYFEVNKEDLNYGYIWQEDQKTKVVKAKNNQDFEIQITSAHVHSDKFIVENDFPIAVPAGGEVAIQVTFVPGEEGSFTDRLTLNSDINNEFLVRRIAQQLELIGHSTAGQGVGSGNEINIIASPNPVRKELKLNFSQTQENVDIIVRNSQGQQVMLQKGLNDSECTIDMSALAGGLYFIEISNSSKQHLGSIKIIKN